MRYSFGFPSASVVFACYCQSGGIQQSVDGINFSVFIFYFISGLFYKIRQCRVAAASGFYSGRRGASFLACLGADFPFRRGALGAWVRAHQFFGHSHFLFDERHDYVAFFGRPLAYQVVRRLGVGIAFIFADGLDF